MTIYTPLKSGHLASASSSEGFLLRSPSQTVTISYLVFPLIPPSSVSEPSKSLFFLDLVSGFEPEGELRAMSEQRVRALARARGFELLGRSAASPGVPEIPFQISDFT